MDGMDEGGYLTPYLSLSTTVERGTGGEVSKNINSVN